MSKKKSLGQQLWEVSADECEKSGHPEGDPPWNEAEPRYQTLYEKIAKRLYKKWSREAIKNYFGSPPKHLTQEQWNAMSDEERLQEKS